MPPGQAAAADRQADRHAQQISVVELDAGALGAIVEKTLRRRHRGALQFDGGQARGIGLAQHHT
jgi:hypothetical protein